MKVAFVIPFAFETFFHDAKSLFDNPEIFEDTVIRKRNTWHINWCRAMQSAGLDVTLYHISLKGKTIREYTHDLGIIIKRVPLSFVSPKKKNEFSFPLLKILKQDKPDVIFSVTHMLSSPFDMVDLITLYCWLNKVPLIARNPAADSYDYIFITSNALLKKAKELKNTQYLQKLVIILKVVYKRFFEYLKFIIKKTTLNITDIIIPQTDKDFNNLVHKFGIDRNKIVMLPKPIETLYFHELSKSKAADKLYLDLNFYYLLHVSNLFDTKGCEHIIHILPELKKKYPGIKLIVVGGGSKINKLKELSLGLGLHKDVIFPGHIDHKELLYYYNIADAFVLPTERIINEGIPNVIMEAIACNTPPISTNIPGPAAVIKDGLGLLIELGNEAELSDAICDVLDKKFIIDAKKRDEFLKSHSLENVGIILKNLIANLV